MIAALDQFRFHHTLENTHGPALVVFTSVLCGACNMLREAMQGYGAAHPATAMFEVDAQRDQGLAEEFEVFHLPALFLYLDGRFHAEIHCEPTADGLAKAITAACGVPADEAP
jgi:thioredoxin-like negative regulator of GroEL